MTFKSYITYEEYVSLGGTVSQDAFPNLERKARQLVNYVTFNRITHLDAVPDEVKELMIEYIDKIFNHEKTAGVDSSLQSYSNGVENLKFNDNPEKSFRRELLNLAGLYLPTYLITRSVNFDVDKYLQSKNNNPE